MADLNHSLLLHLFQFGHRSSSLIAQADPVAPAVPPTTGQYALWGVIASLVVFPILSFGERQYQKLVASHEAEKMRIDAAHQQEKQTLVDLVKNATDDNRKVHQRLGEIETLLKQNETQISSLTQKLAALESQNLALVTENTAIKKLARDRMQRVNDLSNDLTVLRADFANEHATRLAAQTEVARLKSEVNVLCTQLEQPERYPADATNHPAGPRTS